MSSAVAEVRRRNLALGQQLRIQAAAERRALQGAPREVIVAAIVDPSEALAVKRLDVLFAPASQRGLIPGIGRAKLAAALHAATTPYGRRLHEGLRLGNLLRHERRRLADALVAQAPRWWREG